METTSLPNQPQHVLIISHDVVGDQMAGPGIRYFHLARVLSREFDVVLAVPYETAASFPQATLRVVQYHKRNWSSIEGWIRNAKAVVAPSDIASEFPQLGQANVPLVIDGYDPLLAEWLVLTQSHPETQQARWAPRMCELNQQYLLGDWFICASERQRDWWLGLLEASGRVNAWTWREDPSLRRLIDVVPYGLPETPLQHTRQMIKGVWEGIAEQDRVILWGGGLWPWLDPFTAIRAVAQVWQHRQDIRLIFPGTQRPNPAMAGTPTHNQAARALASQLGLLDKAIFFGDWVAYHDWHNVLLESDIALTLHYDDLLETRLAFRSRVLEYIWAGLPIVATCGDATSELVAAHDLGIVVNSQDVDGVAGAILQLLDTPRASFDERFAEARTCLTWERAARPLVEFCRHPRRAPDKVALGDRLGNPFYLSALDRLQAENLNALNRLQAEKEREAAEKERQVNALTFELDDILSSRSWRLMQKVQRMRLRLAPRGSRREKLLIRFLRLLSG